MNRDRSSLTLAAVVAILGFLLVTSISTASAAKRREAPRKAELIRLIDDRREVVDELDDAVAKLRDDVLAAQERASRRSASAQAAALQVEQLALQAGTVAVRGPGVQVTLDHSQRKPSSTEEAGAYRVHDTDVQLVVNALLDAGAEAIAVNGSRVVATTPIRAAGATLVVNFRPVSPPFRIVAVGADEQRFRRSDIARRFKRWTSLFGLEFRVRPRTVLTVPAHTGRVGISSARPAVG